MATVSGCKSMYYDNTVTNPRSQFCFMSPSRLFISSLLLSTYLIGLNTANAEVNISTSIRPLQLIAQAIVEDRGTVTSMIDAQDSAHHFSLTPSDRLSLQSADLLLWISPQFEVQVADLFEAFKDEKEVITAADIPGVSLLMLDEDYLDPHLWLSSANALAIAASLTESLQQFDGEHQQDYQLAYDRFESNLESVSAEIEQKLGSIAGNDYIVFHNAYQYFEAEFGLGGGLALVENAEVQPSMRDLLSFRNMLEEIDPACILLEPDSDLDLVATALEERPITRETVDLLGNEIEDGTAGFSQLLFGVADSFHRCLSN